jgi:hypothetical protein
MNDLIKFRATKKNNDETSLFLDEFELRGVTAYGLQVTPDGSELTLSIVVSPPVEIE